MYLIKNNYFLLERSKILVDNEHVIYLLTVNWFDFPGW